MAIYDYKTLALDTLAAIVGYSASIIPPPAPTGATFNVYTGLTEPEEKDGVWVKIDTDSSPVVVEVFLAQDSDGTWDVAMTMPSGDRNLAGAAVGTKVYMCGGFSNNTATRIYETTTGVWTTGSAMPSGDYVLAGAAVGTKVYVCGGSVNNTATRIYETTTGVWTTGSAMPSGDSNLAGAAVGTKVYMCGGFSNNTATRTFHLPNYTYLDGTIVILCGTTSVSVGERITKLLSNLTAVVSDVWVANSGLLTNAETYIGNGIVWTKIKDAA